MHFIIVGNILFDKGATQQNCVFIQNKEETSNSAKVDPIGKVKYIERCYK